MNLATAQRVSIARRPNASRLCQNRRVVVKAASSSSSAEYESLKGIKVYNALTKEPVELLSLWEPSYGNKVVLPFLTHFADLTSWEYAQKLVRLMPTLENSGVQVVAVGLGSADSAQSFARTLKFPMDKLYADPSGAAYKALGFFPGFGPEMDIPAAAKLSAMLLGIGSPGTVQEVARGYVGDQTAKQVYESPTPFDVLGTGFQRPMELATLRLFNMIGIIPKWSELSPADQSLLTQQGGTLAFNGNEVIYRTNDSGILKYTDVDEMLRTLLSGEIIETALAQYEGTIEA